MRAQLLVTLFLLTAATAAFAQELAAPDIPNLQDPKYYVCRTDADCARINMPCGGFDTVNREFQEEVQNWADLFARSVRCSAHAATPIPRLRCTENRCSIAVP